MLRLDLNYNALRAMPIDAARKALFDGINAAYATLPMVVDAMGEGRALKASANDHSRIIGRDDPLTVEQAKSFLQSERASKFFGGQKWTVPNDHAALNNLAGRLVNFSVDNLREIDLGYTALYDLVDMRGTGQDSFDILEAHMGFTWEQKQPGAQIKPRREIIASNLPVTYITAGDGFSLLDDWLTYGKFYKVQDAVNEFLNTYQVVKAQRHYAPITSQGSGINVAFATDDATTFNAAAAALIRGLSAAGYAIGANVQLDILVAPEKVGRVLAFLDAKRGSPIIAYGTQDQPIAFTVRNVITSTEVSSGTNAYYLVLPGRKLKRGEWMDLKIESQREASVSATDWYGRGQYNAAVGDSDQIKRVAFS